MKVLNEVKFTRDLENVFYVLLSAFIARDNFIATTLCDCRCVGLVFLSCQCVASDIFSGSADKRCLIIALLERNINNLS